MNMWLVLLTKRLYEWSSVKPSSSMWKLSAFVQRRSKMVKFLSTEDLMWLVLSAVIALFFFNIFFKVNLWRILASVEISAPSLKPESIESMSRTFQIGPEIMLENKMAAPYQTEVLQTLKAKQPLNTS